MNNEEPVMWDVRGTQFLAEKIAQANTKGTMDLACLRNKMNFVLWDHSERG